MTQGKLAGSTTPGPVAVPPSADVEDPDETQPTMGARQTQALVFLLSEPTLQAAARAAGIGDRTLRRWLAEDDAFRAAYREARSESMRQATARLQATASEAVDTLRELLSLKERPDVRARAALGILANATKAEELENLAARVDALERENQARRPKMAGTGRGNAR